MANYLTPVSMGGSEVGLDASGFGGTLNPATIGGFTVDTLRTGAGSDTFDFYIIGNAVSYMTGKSLWVNGVEYTLASTPTFDGTATTAIYNASGFNFVAGRQYSIEVGSAFLGPVIVGLASTNFSSATFNITFANSNRIAGDILVIIIETENQAIAAPSGFTQFTSYTGTPSRGTAGGSGGVRMTVFTKDSVGTETTVGIPDSGAHQIAHGYVLRGRAGQSIEIAAAIAGNFASTSGSFTAPASTAADALITFNVASDRDAAAANWSSFANAALIDPVEVFDVGTSTAQGGGVALFAGGKSTAGSVSNGTATHASNVGFAWITLAVQHLSGGGATGALTKSLPAITSSAAGKLAIKSNLAKTLGAIASAATGKLAIRGSTAKTLGPVTTSAAGYHYRLASAAITIGAITATSAGRLAIKGSTSATIGPISAEATGRISIRASLAAVIGPVSSTASGKLAIRGAANRTLGAITSTATGRLALRGALSAAIGPITSSSAGRLAIKASLARALAPVTVTASGAATVPGGIEGTLAVTLAPITASSSGRLAIRGALVRTLPAITVSSAGQHRATASLAVTIGAVTSSSSGRLSIRAALARTIGPIVASAAGKLSVRGALERTLAPITSLAQGALSIAGQLAAAIGDIVIAARGFSGDPPEIPPDRTASAPALGSRIASAPALRDIDRTASASGGSRDESAPAIGSRDASAPKVER